jgi:hypothetical protein
MSQIFNHECKRRQTKEANDRFGLQALRLRVPSRAIVVQLSGPRTCLPNRAVQGDNAWMTILADLFADPLPPWVVIVLVLPGLLLLGGVVVYVGFRRWSDQRGPK